MVTQKEIAVRKLVYAYAATVLDEAQQLPGIHVA
jgi:hypothetical protein